MRKHPLDDLDDDIRDHIERETAENIERGMSSEEARYAARRAFGSAAIAHDNARDVWVWRWVEQLSQDMRYAARQLRRNPAFTLTAVVTLGLAIAATTTMFGVVQVVLLRPLPYQSPEQLAMLWKEDPTQNLREGRSALWDVERWRSQSESFADIATFDSVSTILTGADGAEQIVGASISGNLLPLLGVRPALGRTFSTEDLEQRQPLVMISDRFWHTRFGGSPDALGASLVLNGSPRQIIGILPADFDMARLDADVWTPHTSRQSERGPETWFVVGRLRPAVTFDQAQAEMSAIASRLSDELPAAERNRGVSVVPLTLYMLGPQSRLALWMLGSAVLCVFLIAAANVTSLLLARNVARAREMAVRAALGATAGRIVRQLLTESVALAAVSGLMGTVLALAGIRLIRAFGPAKLPGLNEVSFDLGALGWVLGISVLAGILIGMAAAIATVRGGMRPSGEEGGRVRGGPASRRARRALVVAECALAIVLLVGAGLIVRSWWYVTSIDPGFRPERVLVMGLSAPATFAPAQRSDLYARMLEHIQAVPGVENAGIIGDLFISNSREQVVTVEGDNGTVSERVRFTGDEVSADFFRSMGTPLLRGRFFSLGDGPDNPPVAIINEAMVRRSWPGQDPVGRRFKLGPPDSDRPWYTVVGVVADMRRQGLEREPFPQMFESMAQSPPPRSVDFFIRTSSDRPMTMAGDIRVAMRRVEKNAPISGVAPLEQEFGSYLAQRRFQTSLLTGFSLVALLMAAVGIYGLIHYEVAARTQEIGIRLAVGARSVEIFRLILGDILQLTLIGLIVGLMSAWAAGRAMSTLLYGVTTSDPMTFMGVILILTAVAAAACYFPVRSAMKLDPLVALRCQ